MKVGGEGGGLGEEVRCEDGDLVYTYQGIVCKSTGEIVKETIIVDDGYVRYQSGDPSARGVERIGLPLTYTQHDLGVSVEIEKPRYRNPLKRVRSIVRRGRMRTARVKRSERQVVTALKLLNDASEYLDLPRHVRETAGMIIQWHLARDKNLSDKERRSIVAAAILKTIEYYNLPISQNEVIEVLSVDMEDVWTAKRRLYESGAFFSVMPRERVLTPGQDRLFKRVSTFANRIISELDVSPEDRRKIYSLAMDFVKASLRSGKDLYGKRPESIAAAAIYLAARLYNYDNVSQKTVASLVGIRESNVRKLYRYLIDDMVIIVAL